MGGGEAVGEMVAMLRNVLMQNLFMYRFALPWVDIVCFVFSFLICRWLQQKAETRSHHFLENSWVKWNTLFDTAIYSKLEHNLDSWPVVYFIDFITVKTQQILAIPGCKIVTY